jgi:hypothetical protein
MMGTRCLMNTEGCDPGNSPFAARWSDHGAPGRAGYVRIKNLGIACGQQEGTGAGGLDPLCAAGMAEDQTALSGRTRHRVRRPQLAAPRWGRFFVRQITRAASNSNHPKRP